MNKIEFTKFNRNLFTLQSYLIGKKMHYRVMPMAHVIDWLNDNMPLQWEWMGATSEPDSVLQFRRFNFAPDCPDLIPHPTIIGILSFTQDGDDVIFKLKWAT